ncbi:c-type cytochrome [Pseudorhodobacter sp.]|uniref:c-type cytochrome n=1 Tax=Pseudorhodobacter sp. TaxID=1934400 RepID=UPI002647ACE3|nr:c-type cytochrome [Pseudorhodobacter sp.]MDN5789175.1 c-type cytochrome [Pseudorhodobacter sp.]
MRSGILSLGTAAVVGTVAAAVYLLAPGDAAVSRGHVLYDKNCASCHGKNLEGQSDRQSADENGRYPAPAHDGSGHIWHHSDAALIACITLGGKAALVQMGVDFDSGMLAFGDVLHQQEIEDIIAYIESRWPERERAVQAERSLADDR